VVNPCCSVAGESVTKLLPLPAVFMRCGTSWAVMIHARDLPECAARDAIFLAAMGSPDPNGRQLNGMGGSAAG
jgi:2-methylaconitate cis-trans-isomerase PrpF